MVDLKAQYARIREEVDRAVLDVLASSQYIKGEEVARFEQEFAAFCGAAQAVGVANGTDALTVALRAYGVGPGDEVVTVANTFIATGEAILLNGARPVFVDVDPRTRNIDLELAEAAVTPATRALIPVDLAGLPVDRDRLYALAGRRKLRVVEDAAQSFGATWRGRPLGSFGDFVAFSFHANKNVTTGEGGALVLPDAALAPACEQLRLQGVVRSGEDGMEVEAPGGKWNLTDIAARIGLGQLERLAEFTARRRALARRYFEHWDAALGCELPVADFENCNWHMFQVVLPPARPRAEFMRRMREQGVAVGVHYPAMHLFALYRSLGWRAGQFPHAERIGRSIATLPLFPAMADSDVDRVCDAARKALS
jgi:dTDP-4-amino-4,6-dideoxygalactose transaminase